MTLFLFGLIASLAFWPEALNAALSPRWAVIAVGAPLLLLWLQPRWDLLWKPALAVSIAAGTLFWTPDFLIGLEELVHLVILLGVFWLGACASNIKPLWMGFGTGVGISALIAWAQYFGWQGIDQAVAPAGLFINKNILAEASMVTFVISMFYGWWILLGLAALALFLTASKAALLGVAAVVLVYASKRAPMLATAATGALLAVGVTLFLTDHPSVAARMVVWDQATSGLTWLGSGLGSFTAAFPGPEYAHSEPLQLIYELGIFTIPVLALAALTIGWRFEYGPEESVLLALGVVSCFAFPLHMPLTAFAAALAAGHLARSRVLLRLHESQGRAAPARRRSQREVNRGSLPSDGPVSVDLPWSKSSWLTGWLGSSTGRRTRAFTTDDSSSAVASRARFYTVEKLGANQALTPDGFLLCSGVPIARASGEMLYGPDETPVKPGADGIVKITRDEAEVFRDEFVASFAGKPVVNDHPPEDVRPENWKEYAVGTVLNPRRGTGAQSDLLIADLLIMDKESIQEVRDGKREVSCGYDADYEDLGEGRGRQYNMIGNHVALVDSGRCGPRCAISDRKPNPIKTGDKAMKRGKIWDRVRAAFKARDEEELEKVISDAPDPDEGGEQHIHVHNAADPDLGGRSMTDADIEGRFGAIEAGLSGINDRLDAIAPKAISGADEFPDDLKGKDASAEEEVEDQLEEESKAPTGDAARKARDSAFLADSFQETLALAEILVPGIRVPTYDAKSDPKKTLDAVNGLRRTALDLAYNQPDTRPLIDDLMGGKPFEPKKMSAHDCRTVFRAIAGVKKASNNHDSSKTDLQVSGGGLGVKGVIRSPADLNKKFREHYSGVKH